MNNTHPAFARAAANPVVKSLDALVVALRPLFPRRRKHIRAAAVALGNVQEALLSRVQSAAAAPVVALDAQCERRHNEVLTLLVAMRDAQEEQDARLRALEVGGHAGSR